MMFRSARDVRWLSWPSPGGSCAEQCPHMNISPSSSQPCTPSSRALVAGNELSLAEPWGTELLSLAACRCGSEWELLQMRAAVQAAGGLWHRGPGQSPPVSTAPPPQHAAPPRFDLLCYLPAQALPPGGSVSPEQSRCSPANVVSWALCCFPLHTC